MARQLILALILAAIVDGRALAQQTNLIANGTFDRDVQTWTTNDPHGSVAWNSEDARGSDGSGSLLSTFDSAHALMSSPIQLRPGRRYLLTAMWKAVNQPTPASLQLVDSLLHPVGDDAWLHLIDDVDGQLWKRASAIFTAFSSFGGPVHLDVLQCCGINAVKLDNVGLFQLTPEIDSFVATPPVVALGQPVQLTWRVAGGDLVTLNGEHVPTNGSVTIVPTSSANYTLSVASSGVFADPYSIVLPASLVPQASDVRTLTVPVCTPPVITQQPIGATVAVGSHTTLAVNASGDVLGYQWYQGLPPNSLAIPAANSRVLDVAASSVGTTSYYAVVSGCNTSVASNAAFVSVVPACPTMCPVMCPVMQANDFALSYAGLQSGCRGGATACRAAEPIDFSVAAAGYPFGCAAHTFTWDFGDGGSATTSSPTIAIHAYSAAGAYIARLTIANGVQSLVLSTVVNVSSPDAQSPCSPTAICLGPNQRYEVTLTAENAGEFAWGTAVAQSGPFGYFSLPAFTGDAANPEVFVKVVEVAPGHPWVFYAGLTNLAYTISVTDRNGSFSRSYHVNAAAAGSPQSFGNFDVDGAHSTSCLPVSVSRMLVAPSACVTNSSSLCLLDRFAVAVDADDNPLRSSRRAPGFAVPGSRRFGFFSVPGLTSDSGAIEMFIKMIDARRLNGQFWVFLGSLTDFQLTIRVTDTITGAQNIYVKPAGTTCGWNDVNAFADFTR